jgi:alkylation response protein AidB-like acyl-CoA dehydrogenase
MRRRAAHRAADASALSPPWAALRKNSARCRWQNLASVTAVILNYKLLPMSDSSALLVSVRRIAGAFASQRSERQRRRELDAADFRALSEAGFLLTGVPAAQGGLWHNLQQSTRPIAEILRALARGDSSVALVASMHPAVLSFWLATPKVPDPHAAAWHAQQSAVADAARAGSWWGTITSEPGSGGDVARTKAAASLDASGTWRMTGQKHFGSGSGVASYMVTTAVPDGEPAPDWFFVDMRGRELDRTAGIRVTAPWDGHGMTATQSHALAFDRAPATRVAWPGNWKALADAAGPFIGCLFTGVILGIVDEAIACARRDLAPRKDALRAYDRVEWTRAQSEAWLAEQAYEGMLRAVEQSPAPLPTVLRGKIAVAELAESALQRICRIMGGGTFARHSPYGFWFEDVRALGFLRPPWALAYDALHDLA